MATINGTAGNDTLTGTDILTEEDTIFGLAGDDTLRGLAGRDFLVGGAGNDTLDGGAQPPGSSDLAVYSTTLTGAGAVNFDLAAGTSTDGLGGTDTLINIEGVIGSSSADTLRGDANGSNYLEGGGGNDIIDGRGSNVAGARSSDFAGYFNSPAGATVDLEAGTASDGFGGTDTITNTDGIIGANLFADTLRGNARDNYLIGYGGNDILDGRGGRDLISYFFNTVAGVTVDLAAGTASGGSAGNDTLISIEDVDGSNLFADTLLGNASGNSLIGHGGNDILDGRGGTDTANYFFAPGAVTVNLTTGTASDGQGGTDMLINIEDVLGSPFADTLTGNSGANALFGGAANDTIDGGGGVDFSSYFFSTGAVTVNLATGTASDGQGGTDTLISIEGVTGSAFADTITGNDGANTLLGVAGNDRLDGGGGIDTAAYIFSPAGATVNLATGTASDGYGGTDTLISIENVNGSNFADTLTGTDGVNLFFAIGGNDTLTGGAGIDTAQYQGARSGYAVTGTNAARTVTDNTASRDGTDALNGVERLKFSDGVLAFDNTITDTAGRGYLIYRAAFNREPDATGLGYWINELDRGQEFGSVVAASFIASPEFIALNGTGTTNAQFVNLLYQNVFNRAPDAEGANFWLNLADGVGLNGGYARSNMLASLAISAENVAAVNPLINGGIFFTPFV